MRAVTFFPDAKQIHRKDYVFFKNRIEGVRFGQAKGHRKPNLLLLSDLSAVYVRLLVEEKLLLLHNKFFFCFDPEKEKKMIRNEGK